MLYCYCVALLLFVSSYVLIVCTVPLPPGVNPIAVDKYIYIYLSTLANVACFLSWRLSGITAAVSFITDTINGLVIVMRFISDVEAVLRAGKAR